MENQELKNIQEIQKQAEFFESVEKSKLLKEKFPNIGIASKKMTNERAIEVFNTVEPPVMQFKPKNIEEVRELATGLKEMESCTTLHLPSPKFDEQTGLMTQKNEFIEWLIHESPNKLNVVTTHLGWTDANLVLDEQMKWQDTDLSSQVANELADLFQAGIESGKTMTIENVRFKPGRYNVEELLGSKPEHLIAAREKIIEILCGRMKMPTDEVASKIGYTFDVGHASCNTYLSRPYLIEAWLELIGKDIKLLHIHDMKSVEEKGVVVEKTHLPIGEGVIDWKSFFQLKRKYCPESLMILEQTEENTKKSIDKLLDLE